MARPPTVAIEPPIYKNIKKLADREERSVVKYVNEKLMLLIERDEFLAKYFPFLEKISFHDNLLIIRDNKLKQLFQIYKKHNKIYCQNDESFDCLHTQFALSLLEIGKLTE